MQTDCHKTKKEKQLHVKRCTLLLRNCQVKHVLVENADKAENSKQSGIHKFHTMFVISCIMYKHYKPTSIPLHWLVYFQVLLQLVQQGSMQQLCSSIVILSLATIKGDHMRKVPYCSCEPGVLITAQQRRQPVWTHGSQVSKCPFLSVSFSFCPYPGCHLGTLCHHPKVIIL